MSLLTPSQSVSHKRFHQCVNHKKKVSLRHVLPTFGSFSFFQASLWLGIDKVLQKLTKSYEIELRHLFQCCILIARKCPCKTPFQHTVPRLRQAWKVLIGKLTVKVWRQEPEKASISLIMLPLVETKIVLPSGLNLRPVHSTSLSTAKLNKNTGLK